MIIERNVTRTIKNTTETTRETQSISATTLAFNLITTDFFFLGFRNKFASRHFDMNVANTVPSVVTVEYWNGTAFAAVEDVVDETVGFTESGFIHWQNRDDWQEVAQDPIVDKKLFWIRISVSVNLSAGTLLESVLNLFSNDDLLRQYYPEIVTDTRNLPDGRTNFLEQHLAAKNAVVRRLRQRRLIKNEGQIIDPNQVAVAATHKAAEIILKGAEEPDRELLEDIKDDYDEEINDLNLEVDLDSDGIVDQSEQEDYGFVDIERRG